MGVVTEKKKAVLKDTHSNTNDAVPLALVALKSVMVAGSEYTKLFSTLPPAN